MNGQCAAALLSDGSVVPRECDAALVMRHAQREDIPLGSFGRDISLTEQGVRSAERLGELLSTRRPGRVASSPIRRCLATAQAISRGAGWTTGVVTDWRLGEHGPFISEPEIAGRFFMDMGSAEVVRHQLHDDPPPPGLRETAEGVGLLLDFISEGLDRGGRVSVYITHDAILAALVGWLFKLPVYERGWPNFLDGMIIWRSEDRTHCMWRELQQASHPTRR